MALERLTYKVDNQLLKEAVKINADAANRLQALFLGASVRAVVGRRARVHADGGILRDRLSLLVREGLSVLVSSVGTTCNIDKRTMSS